MEGWIKLYRSLIDWEWYKNLNTKVVFIHLLLKVNYENKKWQGIDIPRGSYITSYQHLADELGLSVRNIRTALNNLKMTHELTIKTTNKYTRITIENWEKFQGDVEDIDKQNDKQADIQTTSKRQQHKNNKNNKNIKNKELAFQNDFIQNQLEDLYEN